MFLLTIAALVGSATLTNSLGTTCTTPLGAGTAAATDPFWMQSIKHQGIAAFNSNSTAYQVFRNVKDFGAKGDGVTDDSAAINAAISAGGRCGGETCAASTVSPAVVFFPSGTYLVGHSIIPYYYTQLIGDAREPPTLLAAKTFTDIAVIDTGLDTDNPGGRYTTRTTDLPGIHFLDSFRSIRNFVIDVRRIPRRVPATEVQVTGIRWQVALATTLINIVFEMSTAVNTAQQGLWIDSGSGGFLGDLVFNVSVR
ncbi:pectate lyase superfamily protein-domain-containing protein, partial [Mycena filopes]